MTTPLTHADAKRIIETAWTKVHGRAPTAKETLYTQAVAWLETNYGRVGQHAKLAAQGKYNWANIERARTGDDCPDGWSPGVDAGSKVCFRVYPTDEEAAEALIRTLTKSRWNTIPAMEGSPEDVAEAMKYAKDDPKRTGHLGYYGAPISTYARGIRNAISAIGKNVPIPVIPAPPVIPQGDTLLPILALGGLGAFAWWRWGRG